MEDMLDLHVRKPVGAVLSVRVPRDLAVAARVDRSGEPGAQLALRGVARVEPRRHADEDIRTLGAGAHAGRLINDRYRNGARWRSTPVIV
jgi:hypothetical protein